MVERGGRKRDGWRDGRGWYRAGGKEGDGRGQWLLLMRNPLVGPGANSATHFIRLTSLFIEHKHKHTGCKSYS